MRTCGGAAKVRVDGNHSLVLTTNLLEHVTQSRRNRGNTVQADVATGCRVAWRRISDDVTEGEMGGSQV